MAEITPVTLDEILQEVRTRGSAEVDFDFLSNVFFRNQPMAEMRAWADQSGLAWERITARPGQFGGLLFRFRLR